MQNVSDIYPLTPGQAGMLYHVLTTEDPGLYFEQVSCDLVGPLDVAALRRAWETVIARHPALRTIVVWEGLDEPRQVVRAEVELPWVEIDLRQHADPEARLAEIAADDRASGFDLRRAPLSRFVVARTADERTRLLWSFHHIVIDGWSASLVFDEVMQVYDTLVGTDDARPGVEPVVEFREHVGRLRDDDRTGSEDFWRAHLADFTEPNQLRVGDPAGTGPFALGRTSASLDADATAQLAAFARSRRLTVNTLVQAAWAIMLSRYCDDDDVVFGVTMSGRPADLPGVERVIGMFLTTLPMRRRVPPPGDPTTVGEWLAETQRDQLGLIARERSSLADIQRWSEVSPGTPLFESAIIFENYPRSNDGPRSIAVENRTVVEQSDLPITIMPWVDDQLVVPMMFDRSRFDLDTMDRLLGHFLRVIVELAQDADRQVADVEMLGDPELTDLALWNRTGRDVADGPTLIELFEAQVAARPDDVALLGLDDQQVTFAELDQRTADFSARLMRLGVRPGVAVGISMRRDLPQVVALAAVVRAGGAYVAIDPAVPPTRAAEIVGEARIGLVLVDAGWAFQLDGVATTHEDDDLEHVPEALDEIAPHDTVFITFTSGSTGHPKGVPAHRSGLVNLLTWLWEEFPPDDDEVGINSVALGFVDHFLGVWSFLLRGRPQIVVPDEVVLNADAFVSVLERRTVRRLMIVPSLFSALLDVVPDLGDRLGHFRWWILSGEAIRPALADRIRRAFPEAVLLNFYGMSELCGGDGTYADDRWIGRTGPIPVGRPLRGVRAHVFDRHGRPSPVGVVGEIRFSGPSLSHGYLGRPDLTAERFVDHPLEGITYRTGDLGRRRQDGMLDYVGRSDHQVKVRGVRVELGDVEANLVTSALVREVAVVQSAVDRDSESQSGRLVAHVVLDDSTSIEGDELTQAVRDHVRHRLPEVMVPAAVITHEELPTTTSGKLDRVALGRMRPRSEGAALDAHEDADVVRMVELWREVLDVPEVGPDSDFFDAGGHSLLALRLFARVQRDLEVSLSPSLLLRAATPRELAAAAKAGRSHDFRHVVVMGEGRPDRPPIYCVHGAGGGILNLRALADELSPEWSLVGIQAPGADGHEATSEDLDEMCERYLAEILSYQPEGPYILAGFSSGGVFAYEIARRLRAHGHAVAALVLLDTFAPGTFMRDVTVRRHLDLLLEEGPAYVASRFRKRRSRRRTSQQVDLVSDAFIERRMPDELRESRSHRAIASAIRDYSARPFGAPVVLFAAEDVLWEQAHIGDERGWRGLASDITVVPTPGDHRTLVEPPHAEQLAAEMMQRLPDLVEHVVPTTEPDPDEPRRPSYAELAGPSGEALRHTYRHEPAIDAERKLMAEIVRPGDRVLDVGTAATGRSARMLRDLGAEVTSIELNAMALREFAATEAAAGIALAEADLLALPCASEAFDHALIAFHGLDYIHDDRSRATAYAELARVVPPGGSVVFDSYNPHGVLLTPSGATSPSAWRFRLSYLLRGRWLRRTMIDANGIRLHQSPPFRVIRQVEAATDLRFEAITDENGSRRSRLPWSFLAVSPYYVFRRRFGGQASS